MTTFEVDPALLGDIGAGLLDSVEVARQVKHDGDALKALASDAGDDTAKDAIEHFIGRWSYGCGCLIEEAEQIADRLQQTSAAYQETETSITEAATVE